MITTPHQRILLTLENEGPQNTDDLKFKSKVKGDDFLFTLMDLLIENKITQQRTGSQVFYMLTVEKNQVQKQILKTKKVKK